MANPDGVNQYSGGGAGGDKKNEKSGAGNAHPDHNSGAAMKAAMESGARREGYSTRGNKHSDR